MSGHESQRQREATEAVLSEEKQVTRSKLGRLEQDMKQMEREKWFRMKTIKNSGH